MRPPRQAVDPKVYSDIFENNPFGAQILEELVARFGGNPYVPGGHEADRATAFNAGKQEVLNFILRRIDQANGADDESTVSTLDEAGAGPGR